jgi:hypothetical protein
MSEKTLAIIRGGKERKEPRDISLSQLPLFKQQEWLDQAEMFVKMLRSSGYIVSKCRGGYNQRDKFGGITRIYDHALLVESMARMRHSVRAVSRSISPRWGSIRFRLALRTSTPWGVRVVSQHVGPQYVWCLTAERNREKYTPEKYYRTFPRSGLAPEEARGPLGVRDRVRRPGQGLPLRPAVR